MDTNWGLNDVKTIEFLKISDDNALISVNEDISVFRIFTVEVEAAESRGMHAHKRCSQWISVLRGSMRLALHDGVREKFIDMTCNGEFIFVPPGIWAAQHYSENSKALVLCDLRFEEDDYIRQWDVFLEFKKLRN